MATFVFLITTRQFLHCYVTAKERAITKHMFETNAIKPENFHKQTISVLIGNWDYSMDAIGDCPN